MQVFLISSSLKKNKNQKNLPHAEETPTTPPPKKPQNTQKLKKLFQKCIYKIIIFSDSSKVKQLMTMTLVVVCLAEITAGVLYINLALFKIIPVVSE